MNNLFYLSEEQKQQMLISIKNYVDRIENAISKKQVLKKMDDADFRNKMIMGFALIVFLSQSCVLSLKKIFDDNMVYLSILESSKNDIFEVKELKNYMLNSLIDENLPKEIIDKDLNEFQLKEYRRKIGEFKGQYIKMFEDKSTIV